jgi:anti-anti-sigma regulatory factor
MHAHLKQGALVLQLGKEFSAPEAERLHETVLSFSPLSQLTLDFTRVREFHDAAFGMLAKTLGAQCAVKVVLRGLTLHQFRMLRYLGAT